MNVIRTKLDNEPTALDQLAAEGMLDLRAAAREAGFPSLSYWALLRGSRRGTLMTAKLGGRVVTSAAAVRRWLAECQPRRDRLPAPPRHRGGRVKPRTTPAERAVLRARGLPTGEDR